MKRFLNKYKRSEDGVVSLEFALIAPMMIFGTLFAINLGYQVNKQQKMTSSLAAGSNYVQDYVMENPVEDLHPSKQSGSNLLFNIRNVVQSAYGNDLKLEEITIDTYCGCPDPSGASQTPTEGEQPLDGTEEGFDFQNPQKGFYDRTTVASSGHGEICGYSCPEPVNGRARVIMELKVKHRVNDLFGKELYVQRSLKTRVR